MTVYKFKLDSPYNVDDLKAKADYAPLKKSGIILTVLFMVSVALMWAGDTFNVVEVGSGDFSMRLTDILAAALIMSSVKGVSEAFILCRDNVREATRRNHVEYVKNMLLPPLAKHPEFTDVHDYMLMNVTYTGECGWWERIGDTDEFMVYDVTLNRDNFQVVAGKQIKEKNETMVG